MLWQRTQVRHGATIVECAIVYPITFLLLLAIVIGGMAVFRYQEVAALARSAARYASTHGAQYRRDAGWATGSPGTSAGSQGGMHWYSVNPTQAEGTDTSWAGDIYDKGARPNLVALDPAKLSCKIGWPPVINQSDKPDNWPGSKVTVTVTYQWMPELFLVGPINLTSTSTMAITN
jgi:Flp pilus assembly protein TadG